MLVICADGGGVGRGGISSTAAPQGENLFGQDPITTERYIDFSIATDINMLIESFDFEEGRIYPITWWPLCILIKLSEITRAVLYARSARDSTHIVEDILGSALQDKLDSVSKLDDRLKNIKPKSPDTLKSEIEDAGGLTSYWDRLCLEVSDQSRFNHEVKAAKSAILAVILRVLGSTIEIAEWLKSEINKEGSTKADSLLFRAAALGIPETVDLLLVHGADLLRFDAEAWHEMDLDQTRINDMDLLVSLHVFLRSLPESVYIEVSPRPVRDGESEVWTRTIAPFRLLQSHGVTRLGPQNVRASEMTWIHIPRNNVSVRRLFVEDNPAKLDRLYSYLYDTPSAI